MQAIKTKYHGPGNVRGSRVKASCERGSLLVEWEHGLNPDQNHRRAAKLLLDKFAAEDVKAYPGTTLESHHWGEFITGEIENGICVHVLVGRFSGWGMLKKSAKALEACREQIAAGKRDGGTMGRLGLAMDAVREALAEVEKEVGA